MKRKLTGIVPLLFLLFLTFVTQAQHKIKVACVGNSITEGYGLKQTYPEVLQQLLGGEYEVQNFGLGGRTLLKKGDMPYWREEKYQQVLAWEPDIVIIKLGTNDSKPQNWRYKEEFVPDYSAFVKSFQALPSNPQVYLALPMPAFEDKWGITENIIKNEVIPAVKKVARQTKVKTIDLYKPFVGKANLTYDMIHPNEGGAALLAAQVHRALKAKGKKRSQRKK
ncbi:MULTISPECIES: GDSL-type esterase/lipase family protein [Rufibacter]|uniref:Lysophospholipase L1-like esterase n=1 Tax=Rufibacter quisquiliarum TaxID=1549639 RepID=A0A839GK78_9BACT|nr:MULTISPECIES: GDSL-type esterase/lipase family protein [Rufibacter]MBA9075436.1 lysophospholipase L1-like esterase [Rufibacter quisquiliarum]